MALFEKTKKYIDFKVRKFYSKAIEHGASMSEVKYLGLNMYKVSVGKLELTYMGKIDGAAEVIGASGYVFDREEYMDVHHG